MTQLFIKPISYQTSTEQLFERIRHLPRPVLLDSSFKNNGTQRFDIISASPVTTLTTDSHHTLIQSATGRRLRTCTGLFIQLPWQP